jgi:GNAT superfamily N-acetyltransferase
MGIDFRPARLADAEQLVGLVEELGYPSAPEAVRARLAGLLAAPEQAVFVASNARDEVVGWVHVQAFHSLATDAVGLVTGLVVAADVRRGGVGRGLMRAAEDWARARGLASMRLRSRVARADAHAFYRRLGFEVAKEQLQFRKELR